VRRLVVDLGAVLFHSTELRDPGILFLAGVIGTAVVLAVTFLILGRRHQLTAPSKPTHGPIVCPHCNARIAEDVQYFGQNVCCFQCHGLFLGPGLSQRAAFSFVQAAVVVVSGLVLLRLAQNWF
jgi:hypothetical protein